MRITTIRIIRITTIRIIRMGDEDEAAAEAAAEAVAEAQAVAKVPHQWQQETTDEGARAEAVAKTQGLKTPQTHKQIHEEIIKTTATVQGWKKEIKKTITMMKLNWR